MIQADCLDPGKLERLRRLGGDTLVRGMIEAFLDAAPSRLRQARAALDQGDLLPLRMAMHSLRSTAGNFGAATVQELARQLEAAAASEDAHTIAGQLPLLEQHLGELVARLRTELEQRAP